jgi:hypothetical protein
MFAGWGPVNLQEIAVGSLRSLRHGGDFDLDAGVPHISRSLRDVRVGSPGRREPALWGWCLLLETLKAHRSS